MTIKLLYHNLLKSDISTKQSEADIVIIKKSFGEATKSDVDVVTEDTDILVLFIYHWNDKYEDLHDKYFNAELNVKQGKVSPF